MIPIPVTPILGRKIELDETAALLGRTRLLTLTGAGGSGKTRLAIELAQRDDREVAWIDLGSIHEAQLVAQQTLEAIGLHEPPARDVMTAVVDALRDREMLLVFDNCEHLVDAVAALVERILVSCAGITVLTTTREALGIAGEHTWLVPPLAHDDAIQLFAERARAVLPIFAIEPHNERDVAQICERLDRIPLAIELAAARAKVLSIRQIAERLDDAFSILSAGSRTLPRHRTIRATIEWSWRLLTEQEQIVFRRLAVFAGSFAIDAVDDRLDALSSLVDKSLVICDRSAGKARYRLLETVRQFAAEKLEQAGELSAARERHARFYLALAEAAEPALFAGGSDLAALEKIDDDIANVRAVFDDDEASAEVVKRLVYALHWYWFARGHFHEARERAAAAVRRELDDPVVNAKARIAAGHAAVWQGDFAAIDVDPEPLRGDPRALSSALMLLAVREQSNARFEEAIAVARQHGGVAVALMLYWSGVERQNAGDTRAARAKYEEALAIGVAEKSTPATAHPLTVLGWLHLYEARRDDAMIAFRRALELHASIDDRWGLTQVVEGIAFLVEDEAIGVRLLAAAEAAWMNLGARPVRAAEYEERRNGIMRSALTDEFLRRAVASGAAMPYEEMVALARTASAPAPTTAGTAGAPRLSVKAFGDLQIQREGETVDLGRARELLLYLLCNPKGASKEQIGAALWPEADPQRVRNNFHVTLHRLRKGVGDVVELRGDVYRVCCPIDFDVAAFLDDPQSQLDLYRGEFFERGAGEWIDEQRARLRERYASVLVEAGRARITAGDYAGAAALYERLLSIDEFDEQAARQLMTCYGKLGDFAGAARVYKRLESALKRELSTKPDPATTKIFQRVTEASKQA